MLDALNELLARNYHFPQFAECTILFEHIYREDGAIRDIRDHDNLEYRGILNLLDRYLLTSDCGIYCTNIHTTCFGKEDKTVIHVLPGKLLSEQLLKMVRP